MIVVQLNEINFDLVGKYVAQGRLSGLARLKEQCRFLETYGESEYENLEPWIQWVSAQTGLTYGEHRVFRLGDIVNSNHPQVFERLEEMGLKVGAISPMNARNALRHPAYFIPDPWTQTSSDGSGLSVRVTEMLRQAVNENASRRLSFKSILVLIELLIRTFEIRETAFLLSLAARSARQPWLRSLVLDYLVHMFHRKLLNSARPDVSFVFLNAGAHVQHHYMLNSPHVDAERKNPGWYVGESEDPVFQMLEVYDRIIADYLDYADAGARLVVATGLTQVPYPKATFYYRFVDHADFLRRVGIRFARVLPRMTRDFEIQFEDRKQAVEALDKLRALTVAGDGLCLFEEIEDRGISVFATLTYPREVDDQTEVRSSSGEVFKLKPFVVFVAVKNGMHSTKGFAFFSPACGVQVPEGPAHVRQLHDSWLEIARNRISPRSGRA